MPLLLISLPLAAVAAVCFVAWRRLQRRDKRLFPYSRRAYGQWQPAASVQRLACAPAAAPATWQLPPVPDGYSAVLAFAGHAEIGHPYAVLRSGDRFTRHELPSGWRGCWSLDVTSDGPGIAKFDALVADAAPTLLLSAEQPGPSEPLLVVAPHPDDAELAAFGLYASRADRTCVVTCTAGERGTGVTPGEPTDATFARALRRARESLEIPPRFAGVPRERCFNLLLPDGGLGTLLRHDSAAYPISYDRPRLARELQPSPAAPPAATGRDWIAALRRLIVQSDARVIACPDPLCDAHPDHQAAAIAVARALADLPPGQVRAIYLYTVHATYSSAAPFGIAGAPWDPPPLLHDVPLTAFYSQPLSDELIARKHDAVLAFSDVVANVTPPPPGRQPHYLDGPNPTELTRRCLRRTEWFRVVSPADLLASCPRPPSPS